MAHFSFFNRRDLEIPDTSTTTIGPYSRLAGRSYDELKDTSLRNGTLFTDPDFPADERSLGLPGKSGRYTWKRPKEINRSARFVADGVSRFDVKQGELGDCWLAAGLVALCNNRSLMDKVVPLNQTIQSHDYAGIFRFMFWQYGKWTEVIVDDRLPTIYGQPAFIASTDETEFWSALLEKAYAKLHGSYSALEGGHAIEAMEDFTGGVCEWFDLAQKAPADLYTIMAKGIERSSLLSCAIEAGSHEMEAELRNGLIKGHAYTVSWVRELTLNNGQRVRLVRLRNPWGNDREWKLAWSDKSSEWYNVPDWEKKDIEFARSADGEFWMSYEDFVNNFSKLEICNLGPDALTDELAGRSHRRWEMTQHEGEWLSRVSAGGCLNNWKTSFCCNPQFRVDVENPDDGDVNSTLLVALMQKQQKSLKKTTSKNIPIGYAIYKIDDPARGPLDVNFIRGHGNPKFGTDFTNLREISNRYKVMPGHYCIVPSTFEAGVEREFILRIYSEKPNRSQEMDDVTRNLKEDEEESDEDSESDADSWNDFIHSDDEEDEEDAEDGTSSTMSRLNSLLSDRADDDFSGDGDPMGILAKALQRKGDDPRQKKSILAAYGKLSDYSMEIDAYKLSEVITKGYGSDFDFEKFSVDVCKGMVAMLDEDRSGKLNFQEFNKLWKSLRKWTVIFQKHDADDDGFIQSFQLRQVLRTVGYSVSNQTFQTLVQRYGDLEGRLYFQEFVHCVVRLNNMFDVFDESGLGGTIELNLDQFIQTTMYS